MYYLRISYICTYVEPTFPRFEHVLFQDPNEIHNVLILIASFMQVTYVHRYEITS